MPASQYNMAVAVKTALVSAFIAEQVPGGKLASVVSIQGTNYNETGQTPYVSVDLIRTKEAFVASHRTRVTMDFAIGVSCKSTGLLVTAYNQRDLLIDSGDGSTGVQPILRELMTTLLGGLVEKLIINETLLLSNVDSDKSAAPVAFFADALIMVTCYQSINV